VAVVDWDKSPSDFWSMTSQEWWWIYDKRVLNEKSIPDESGISEMDREKARAAHKEKMNDRT